jgi:phage host-nuclease inhibitor protein Gam
MNKIATLQSEFEVLIAELEKLKSINELTSANTESARQVIVQVESFIKGTSDFESTLRKEQTEQFKKLNESNEALAVSIARFDESKNSLTSAIESLLEAHQRSHKELLNKAIDNVSSSLKQHFTEELSANSKSVIEAVHVVGVNSETQNRRLFWMVTAVAIGSSIAAICSALLLYLKVDW